MKKFFLLSIIVLFFFGMFSCNKDEKDKEAPSITLTEPEEGETFTIATGDSVEIHFNAIFSDNEALKSYKIDIHNAEGHSHKAVESYDTVFTGALSGIQFFVHQHIFAHPFLISDTGHYHLVVYALDGNGNEQMAYREIHIGTMSKK